MRRGKTERSQGWGGRHRERRRGEREPGRRLIHVTTSGLVFLQKLGVAATENDIEFESGGLTGHAVGAEYNSDTGVVVLHSAVRVNGLEHDRPVVLTASHAVLDRPGKTLVLLQAKYASVGGKAKAKRDRRRRRSMWWFSWEGWIGAGGGRRRGDADQWRRWKRSGSAGRNDFECAKSAGVGGDDGRGEVWLGRSAAAGEG